MFNFKTKEQHTLHTPFQQRYIPKKKKKFKNILSISIWYKKKKPKNQTIVAERRDQNNYSIYNKKNEKKHNSKKIKTKITKQK